jgi:hypothetical protein
MVRAGTLLSFGRPTYGRLGQKDADVGADAACPEPKPVDGLEGVRVVGAAGGLAVSGAGQGLAPHRRRPVGQGRVVCMPHGCLSGSGRQQLSACCNRASAL